MTEHSGKYSRIELRNFTLHRFGRRRYNLITCRDNAHHRFFYNAELMDAAGNQRADSRRADFGIRGQEHITGADVLPDLADMLPRRRRMIKAHAVFLLDNILNHHNCVAAVGKRVPGVNGNKLVFPQNNRRCFSGAVSQAGVKGDSVHGAGVVVRRTQARVNGAGGDPTGRMLNRYRLAGRGHAVFLQQGYIFLPRFVQRDIRQIFKAHLFLLLLLIPKCNGDSGAFRQTFAVPGNTYKAVGT